MRLIVVGCSGSYPGPASPASCYLLQAEHEGRTWSVVLDLGSGALGPLQRFIDPRDLDAVLLTHLHPDHCLDTCSLYVMLKYTPGGPHAAVPVHAPPGAAARLSRAYSAQEPESLEGPLTFSSWNAHLPVRIGPFTVTPIPMCHPVQTFGLRVEADGAVLAYTGDTDTCPGLLDLFAGATLALTDCAYLDGRDELRGVHLSGSRAAAAAVAAGGVQRLMLTHIPPWNDPHLCHDQAAAVWPGMVEFAEPLAAYDL